MADVKMDLECTVCHQTGFKGPAHLGRHKRFAHKIPGRAHKHPELTCGECGKVCKTKSSLKMHKTKVHIAVDKTEVTTLVVPERNTHVVKKQRSGKANGQNPVHEDPTGLIAHTVGQFEAIAREIAFQNDLPAKSFTSWCAEYFRVSAMR